MRAGKKGKDQDNAIEPATTISDDGMYLTIVAKLPGIREEGIRIYLENATLIISAAEGSTKYRKEMHVPPEANLSRKRFRDETLEITLENSCMTRSD
jgi:HSP20 family molecular chaperone IbpA